MGATKELQTTFTGINQATGWRLTPGAFTGCNWFVYNETAGIYGLKVDMTSNSANVGINATAPLYQLDVRSADAINSKTVAGFINTLQANGTFSDIRIGRIANFTNQSISLAYFYNSASVAESTGRLRLTAGTDAIYFNGLGRVGIGKLITATSEQLEVGGSVLADNYLKATQGVQTPVVYPVTDVVGIAVKNQTLTTDIINIDTSNNITSILGTTDATTSTTGALVVSGGVGVSKNMYLGNNLNVYGDWSLRKSYADRTLGIRAMSLFTPQTVPQLSTAIGYSPELPMVVALNFSTTTSSYSTDGINWNTMTTPSSQWRDVTWSPELGIFAAVAPSSPYIMTSPDGINWTTQTSPNTNLWNRICWSPELGLFCAIAFNNTINNFVMTSSDGTTWTAQTTPFGTARGVAWSSELATFVVLGQDSIFTSIDGTTWTTGTIPTGTWTSAAWSAELGLFCAVSNSTATDNIATSPDAITWTTRSKADTLGLSEIRWAPELGMFVAIHILASVSDYHYYSPDGINWT
jgi:hypothetical protein